ncbi:MAG: type 1 glutamine amidotransferase [Saprospiraceae bacterium]|nr:type 1 glutamine amidotransferase [Saprospiraceae bacterium]
MKNSADLKILLVQIRKDESLLAAERREFVEFSGLDDLQFITWDVFREPDFVVDVLQNYDAIMMGGLSDDESDTVTLPSTFDPFVDNLHQVMLHAIEYNIPSLLSCGGFMLASQWLGAEVIIDPDQAELGMYSINLTQDGQEDMLFQTFPPSFKAVSGHIKSTIKLPPSCLRLAYSERCQVHGFKVKTAPFYAFQFHPEITCKDLLERVEAYKDKYFDSEKAYQKFIRMSGNTAIANSIVTRFVELVAAGGIVG